MTTSWDVAEILKFVKEKLNDKIGASMSCSRIVFPPQFVIFLVHTIALSALPYAEGASWDSSRVCLPTTRVALLEEIWDWANDIDSPQSAKLFWLADVAGAGKSAIGMVYLEQLHARLNKISFQLIPFHNCVGRPISWGRASSLIERRKEGMVPRNFSAL